MGCVCEYCAAVFWLTLIRAPQPVGGGCPCETLPLRCPWCGSRTVTPLVLLSEAVRASAPPVE